MIYQGKGFYSITECEPVYSFKNITDDYDKICYAVYFSELIEKTIREGEECDEILTLFLYALHSIDKEVSFSAKNDTEGCIRKNPSLYETKKPKVIRVIFEFKFMQLCGFEPSLACYACGEKNEDQFFCEYGVVCERCAVSKGLPVSTNAINILHKIFTGLPKSVFSLSVQPDVLRELRRLSEFYLRTYNDIKINSLGFID